jgi:glycosyltransferase involved in cell wall biosynthesis
VIPRGGTELLYDNLIKNIGNSWQQHANLIVSFCNRNQIQKNKINVLWQHLMHDQAATTGMNDDEFVDSIAYFVYVSHWQLQQFAEKFDISSSNNLVIKNAINPIPFIPKPQGKIKLIYTSMPNRGLELLLDAFDLIQRKDIELTVFSSNIIYGLNYSKSVGAYYDHLFHRCKTTDGIKYRGYAMNKAVRQAVQQSHVFAYPSIYQETSCLAAIEAGAAGCKIVTTNYGALPETCGNWATYVDYSADYKKLTYAYAHLLNNAIDDYQHFDPIISEQSAWFNKNYSWDTRKSQWQDFFIKMQQPNSITN